MIPRLSHNRNLDILRGLAVLAVVCHHLFAHTGLSIPFLGHLGGLLGVQLFFLISGYLIVQSAYAYPLSAYVVWRLLRIFPVYWLLVLGWSAWYGKLHWAQLQAGWPDFVANLLALTHFVPAALFRYDVLTVSWTLSIELAWYLLVPLIVWLAGRWPGRGFWPVLLLTALSISSAWVGLAHAGKLDGWYASAIARAGIAPVNDFARFAFIVNAFPAQLVFFVMGCLIWRYQAKLERVPGWLLLSLAVIFAGWPEQWNHWLSLNPSFASGVGLAALFLLVLRQQRWRLSVLKWLGDVSYPVYLLHVPVLLLVFQQGHFSGWPAAVLALLIIFVAAMALHRWVELPCIALGRKLITSKSGYHAPTPRPV
jgi:peptidoglycan/LPS O-acetylase OafA/YrhL